MIICCFQISLENRPSKPTCAPGGSSNEFVSQPVDQPTVVVSYRHALAHIEIVKIADNVMADGEILIAP